MGNWFYVPGIVSLVIPAEKSPFCLWVDLLACFFPCINEHKGIVCSNTKNDENWQNMENTKIGKLEYHSENKIKKNVLKNSK